MINYLWTAIYKINIIIKKIIKLIINESNNIIIKLLIVKKNNYLILFNLIYW